MSSFSFHLVIDQLLKQTLGVSYLPILFYLVGFGFNCQLTSVLSRHPVSAILLSWFLVELVMEQLLKKKLYVSYVTELV